MRILPPKQKLIQFLGSDDFFLWEYYGEGVLGKIQAWIFRSRIKVLMEFLRKVKLNPRMILDVGCGPIFISYTLVSNATRKVAEETSILVWFRASAYFPTRLLMEKKE